MDRYTAREGCGSGEVECGGYRASLKGWDDAMADDLTQIEINDTTSETDSSSSSSSYSGDRDDSSRAGTGLGKCRVDES